MTGTKPAISRLEVIHRVTHNTIEEANYFSKVIAYLVDICRKNRQISS